MENYVKLFNVDLLCYHNAMIEGEKNQIVLYSTLIDKHMEPYIVEKMA